MYVVMNSTLGRTVPMSLWNSLTHNTLFSPNMPSDMWKL